MGGRRVWSQQRFRLARTRARTDVLQDPLHDADGDLGRLDEAVLAVLDVEPGLLHLGALGRLEHLARRVELEPGLGDGVARADGVLDRLRQRLLERLKETLRDLREGVRR